MSFVTPQAVEQASTAVHRVLVPGGQGTAVAVGPRLLLTAAHVVAGQSEAVLSSAPGYGVAVDVVIRRGKLDLALLALRSRTVDLPASVSIARTPVVLGVQVWMYGYPDQLRLVRGIHLGQEGGLSAIFGGCQEGMSGGPVLDPAGNLVGIISGGLNVPDGMARAASREAGLADHGLTYQATAAVPVGALHDFLRGVYINAKG
jgi:S1-C subfamily serine protease